MDPITVTRLVQDRTQDLQRIADQVRQERALRSTAAAAAEATPPVPARAAEPRLAPVPVQASKPRQAPAPALANDARCDLAEPAA